MMCKMVKKGLVGAGLGALTLGLLFGTSAPHYARTAFHKVRHAAQDNVPIEYKIDEARQQVAALEPAIRQHCVELARATYEVDRLREEILVTKRNLEREGQEILALKDGLESGRLQLTSAGVSYTADEVKADLARRLDSFRGGKAILGTKEETLKQKQENVVAIRKALNEMAGQKKELESKVEGIETRLSQIRAAQATNDFTFDTTPLSQAKQTIAELDKQLEVMARTAEYEGQYVERGVAVEIEPARDILKEVEAEFGQAEGPTGKSL